MEVRVFLATALSSYAVASPAVPVEGRAVWPHFVPTPASRFTAANVFGGLSVTSLKSYDLLCTAASLSVR